MYESKTWSGRSSRGRRARLSNATFNRKSCGEPQEVDSSPYFLPRSLQQPNPWEDAGPGCNFEREYCDDSSRLSRRSSPKSYAAHEARHNRSEDYDYEPGSYEYRGRSSGHSHCEDDEYRRCDSSRGDRFGSPYSCYECDERHSSARDCRPPRRYHSPVRRCERSELCRHGCRCDRGRHEFSEDDYYSSRYHDHHYSPRRLTREEWRQLERQEYERQHRDRSPDRSVHRESRDFEHQRDNRWKQHDYDERPRSQAYSDRDSQMSENRGRRANPRNFDAEKEDRRRYPRNNGGGSRGRGSSYDRGSDSSRGSRGGKWRDNRRSGHSGYNKSRGPRGEFGGRVAENDWEEERRAMSGLRLDDGEGDIAGVDMKMEAGDSKMANGEVPSNSGRNSSKGELFKALDDGVSPSEKVTAAAEESKNSDTESDCDRSRPERETKSASGEAASLPNGCCMIAPKIAPATRKGKERVELLTNFWEVHVESKIVYRYDVAMFLGTPVNERAVDCLRGPRDDSASVSRRRLCLNALRFALETYRIVREGTAIIHDGAGMLFSSEDLSAALKERNGVLTISIEVLPVHIRRLIQRVDVNSITIEVGPCRDAAASFDMANLSSQTNRNLASIDRSWKQFYELLTSQDAVASERFTQFGAGCLYCQSSFEEVGHGFQRFFGAQKGIRFIEGNRPGPNNVVAALLLDHRVGLFFKNQDLMKSVCEMGGIERTNQFDFSSSGRGNGMNPKWNEVNEFVKGVRVSYFIGSTSNPISFVATGISDKPIKDLKYVLPNRAKAEVSVLAKFSDIDAHINPNWPAVKWRRFGNQVQYFPMELLKVDPNQRVPLEKQINARCTLRADKPDIRLNNIHRLLEALNLHSTGVRNRFLRAFGVTVSRLPKTVEGFRRAAPQISYAGNQSCPVDKIRYNWRPEKAKYVEGGKVDRILIVHGDERLFRNVRDCLQRTFASRGMLCGKVLSIFIDYRNLYELEDRLRKVFIETKKSEESSLIFFIDRLDNKSHDFLKLMERKYLIPTQQITAELAERLPRQPQSCNYLVSKTNLKIGGFNYDVVPESFAENIWIAKGRTLIVGYDVAHPGRPTRDELMNKMPPLRPSVVGFSFNGAAQQQMFIGDYHYQTPRREKVEREVLNARFKWMLDLFTRNRKVWPESVVITRDGVSEGQYRMVIEEELSAIREACEEFGNVRGREAWSPRFTVAVATKRHNARFFSENRGRIENPKPATVVDTDVVRSNVTEFFMQSHHPVQGTAKPTSYQLIVDENNMNMDELQALMLALTFHHQISDAPVSLPEPVYQADEWAKRGKSIWNAYMERHQPLYMEERGPYASVPIDFEGMTNRLAFWNTKLEERRVNA